MKELLGVAGTGRLGPEFESTDPVLVTLGPASRYHKNTYRFATKTPIDLPQKHRLVRHQ